MSKSVEQEGGFEIPSVVKTIAIAAAGALVLKLLQNSSMPDFIADLLEEPRVY